MKTFHINIQLFNSQFHLSLAPKKKLIIVDTAVPNKNPKIILAKFTPSGGSGKKVTQKKYITLTIPQNQANQYVKCDANLSPRLTSSSCASRKLLSVVFILSSDII